MEGILSVIAAWISGIYDQIVKAVKSVLAWLFKPFEMIGEYLDSFWNWLTDGIYDVAVWAFKGFIEYTTLASLEWTIWSIGFAWDIAKEILQDLNFAQMLASAWSALPGEVVGLLTLLRIPEIITLLVTALVTKFVLRFIPQARL